MATEGGGPPEKSPTGRDSNDAWGGQRRARRIGLIAGIALFVAMLLIDTPTGLSPAAWRTACVAALMAVWWITEAIPLPATALLPVLLLPLLGIRDVGAATAPYANPVVFLFLGGFVIARAMQRWGLHRRIALMLLARMGGGAGRTIAGFMLATSVLSMWVSNTAAAAMMLPIGLSVIDAAEASGPEGDVARQRFAAALLLGIAYAASIGGMGTLIGSPPNALLAGFVSETYGLEIGFGRWMVVGLPMVAMLLPLSWLVLTRLAFPTRGLVRVGSGGHARAELSAMGGMSRGEWAVAAVFGAVALAWVGRPFLAGLFPGAGFSDAGIAVAGAVALFLIPVDLRRGQFAMTWRAAKDLPWGVLILFGGGLSLAGAISGTGLAGWIGQQLSVLAMFPPILVVAAVIAVIVFLTELTSNTATAAAFLPVAGALASSLALGPVSLLVPVALAASCAFMMPVATPPNAIVFGSERLAIADMLRAGIWMNLIAIVVLTLVGGQLATLLPAP